MTTAVVEPSVSAPQQSPGQAPVVVRVAQLTKRFLVRRPVLDTLLHPFRHKYARALHDVNCEIFRGEFFGFLGANGAGKTTLFKILATLVTPDAGKVEVDGVDVRVAPADVRRILTPVIADERSLRWRLSARENLRLYAVLYGVPSAKVKHRVDEVLERVGLDPVDMKLVGRFSSGMRQRLLIARALIPSPKILLLDEPTRSLDPVAARDLRAFLRGEICRRLGCTVLLATHTAEEAFELCDRVAIMHRGHPLAIGATHKLMLQYGEERYRIWTREGGVRAVASLMEAGLATGTTAGACDEDGWTAVDAVIPGGLSRAAEAVELLAARGVPIGRFERVGMSLGDLIQRVVRSNEGNEHA
jgi:ABC-2 type transport system ATP-binding protein